MDMKIEDEEKYGLTYQGYYHEEEGPYQRILNKCMT